MSFCQTRLLSHPGLSFLRWQHPFRRCWGCARKTMVTHSSLCRFGSHQGPANQSWVEDCQDCDKIPKGSQRWSFRYRRDSAFWGRYNNRHFKIVQSSSKLLRTCMEDSFIWHYQRTTKEISSNKKTRTTKEMYSTRGWVLYRNNVNYRSSVTILDEWLSRVAYQDSGLSWPPSGVRT